MMPKPVPVPGPVPSAGPDFLRSPTPSVQFPGEKQSLEAEVVRLRRMVHALAEMLVDCGVVDSSMVEGRLRLASVETEQLAVKKPSLWSRLFGRKNQDLIGAVPSVMMPVDQTVPVQKLPFEVQSLYDEHNGPSVVAPGLAATTAARATVGNCARCWRRAPLQGQLCARCAVRNG
jgi:hypothetical protein